ncbi:MAG: FHA domain-containing protein [Planctomycetes bacterium]|nr:FHA domain-containing protein [Planctomycetota bacterium]
MDAPSAQLIAVFHGESVEGAPEETAYSFRGRAVIGRADGCDVRLPDAKASRHHAEILWGADGYVIRDLGSRNGVFVNGQRVQESSLRPGDEVEIGFHRLTLVLLIESALPTQSPRPAPPSPALSLRPREFLFLVGSLAVHLLLVLAFARVQFGKTPPPRRPIALKTDLVGVELKESPKPMRASLEASSVATGLGAGPGRIVDDVPIHVPSLIALPGLKRLWSRPSPSLDARPLLGADKPLLIISDRDAKPRARAAAVDDLATEIAAELKKRPLTVVWLFDESLSLLNDRKLIYDRIASVAKGLKDNLTDREFARLDWAVASFCQTATILQKSTRNIEKVRDAIADVKIDPTGEENVLAALRACANAFASPNRATFLVIVTDETGNDTADEALVEDALSLLKRRKARVYVLGREANFGNPQVAEDFEDPETHEIRPLPVDRGPDCADAEVFFADGFFNTSTVTPSGYGTYVLSRFAHETEGKYYILADAESPYDSEKLRLYAPELCSRRVYVQRQNEMRVRKALRAIADTWEKALPPTQIDGEAVEAAIIEARRRALEAYAFCRHSVEVLKPLAADKKRDPFQPKRWEANYDLAFAQLHKFRFLLGQYVLTLNAFVDNVLRKPTSQIVGGLSLSHGAEADPLLGGKDSEHERDDARELFQTVLRNHASTPWAAVAEQEMRALVPLRATPRYVSPAPPGPPSFVEPQPPKQRTL